MKIKVIKLLIFISLAIVITGYFTSCSTAKKYAAFDVSYTLPKTYFHYSPTILKNGEVIIYSAQVSINLDSLCMAHDIPSGWIASASFSHFAITITDPPEANFGWLQKARAVVSNYPSFEPNSELGNFVNSDSTAKAVIFSLNTIELQPYIHKTSFYYEIIGTLNGTFPYNLVSMYLDASLKLHIEPL